MKITVIGLGYIGLPTASTLASLGNDVLGVDVDAAIVKKVNQGKIHILEQGLEDLVKDAVSSGNLRASTVPEKSDIFIIAVPTPLQDNKEPDLHYIKEAAESISPFLEKGNLVILESTVPVGATEKLSSWLADLNGLLSFPKYTDDSHNFDIFIAHCPERVLPGNVLKEIINNDRTIGGLTNQCSNKAKEFYSSFSKGKCHLTNSRTAELSKLVENSYRDVNIAFANELSMISDRLDIDVWKLIELSNFHPRVDILQPGPGVGGHCIAVDPWFIVDSAPEDAFLIKKAREVNDNKLNFVVKKIKTTLSHYKNRSLDSLSIVTMGLSFKANIDDLRESPALEIAHQVSKMGFLEHLVVEPNIERLPEILVSPSSTLVSTEEGLKKADIVVILVDHDSFKSLDHKLFHDKEIIDTRGLLNEGDLSIN